jgi:hypothetical protein
VLLLAGLVVFVPLSGIELLDDRMQEPLADAELDQIEPALLIAIFATIGAHAIAALLGEVIYTGIVAAAITRGEPGHALPPLRELLGHLPLGRLVAVDLLWVLVVVVGFIAFVVPAFIFIVWFALVAPAVEIEERGVIDAFRRSRELARRRFWLVFVLVLPLFAIADLFGSAAQSASLWGLGEGVAGDWVGAVLANLLVSPFTALVAVFLFLGLRECPPASAGRSSPRTRPPGHRRSHREPAP